MRTKIFISIIFVIFVIFEVSDLNAQKVNYPTSPITLINPMPIGGAVEISNRALSKYLQQSLGQPIMLEIKPGGQGTIAGKYVVDAKPDGYTIGTFGFPAYAPEAYTRLIKAPYTSHDLVPVVRWLGFPFGFTSIKGKPWNDMKEFVAYIQKNPKKSQDRPSGFWCHPYHIMFYSLAKANNLDVIEIPYKGSGDLKTALLGGHVDVGITSLSSVKPFVDAGKLYFLAMQNPKRLSEFPSVPTFEELGYRFSYYASYGLFVPKGNTGKYLYHNS